MTDDIVIKVDRVSKNFILPHERVNSIKSAFTNLTKRRRKSNDTQHALKDISFDVKKGEFFGIVGRNGSGKSTMLKILAGIYQPTKGSIRVKGKLVPFIELGVGFNPELTGRENVYLNGAMLGFSKSQVEAMYDDIVAFAELSGFMDQKLKNYSSGMQVRLAFSMATRAEADVLLVDEVLAVGDADFQRKCFRYFKELKRQKVTVVFVTHDMSAVREYCDRAILINEHEIMASGTAYDVAQEYDKLLMPASENESSKASGADKDRWGDMTIEIDKLKIADLNEESIHLTMHITAHQACEDPIFGFLIRNATGEPMFGTNTSLEKQKIGNLNPGDSKTIEWEFTNILQEGSYSVTVAAHYDGGMTAADWQDNALKFDIVKSIRTPYPLQPPVKVSVI